MNDILDREVLDSIQMIGDMRGDENYLADLITMFDEQSKKTFEKIEESIASDERKDLRHWSHRLKGSAQTLGALELADNCSNLEAYSVAEDYCSESARSQFNRLVSSFYFAKQSLQNYTSN